MHLVSGQSPAQAQSLELWLDRCEIDHQQVIRRRVERKQMRRLAVAAAIQQWLVIAGDGAQSALIRIDDLERFELLLKKTPGLV